MNNYDRQILALNDKELERFVRDWVQAKSTLYYEVARFSGSGDLGRDVVGFLSSAKHEGLWDNYQCKQYTGRLPTATAYHEIGKILYYAHLKTEFTAPNKYFFVAPRGLNRNLERLIFNPSMLKQAIISDWDEYCAETIIDGKKIAMTQKLKEFIESYEFANIGRITIDDMLDDASIKPVLYKWFGADPGPAPEGFTPKIIQEEELPYIGQLLKAYGQRESAQVSTPEEIVAFPNHHTHMQRQRERFYDADAFRRFYRDNTNPETIISFEKEIYHGIVETNDSTYSDALYRIDGVMKQAANIQPSGPLAKHARTFVKQGICHHFVNESRLTWTI